MMCRAVMDAAGVCDIALPSFEDEAAHFGDADAEATTERYARAGAATVVVKNGAGPVLFRHNGLAGSVAAPPVDKVVDTTSAGDSFNAGVLAGLDAGQPIEAAILTACRVAGQVIARAGALVPLDTDAIRS
jgi:2-dehydro-3-deoxygluconokinase